MGIVQAEGRRTGECDFIPGQPGWGTETGAYLELRDCSYRSDTSLACLVLIAFQYSVHMWSVALVRGQKRS